MINKVMLTMESRIHGDMYVRFGGRLVETYYRKVEKRCWPSLLKKLISLFGYLVFNSYSIFHPNNQEKNSFLSQNIYTNY